MSEIPLFIKVKAECILPIPHEVRDDLDAVAEHGLAILKALIEDNVTTAIPGTIQGSWQSMPRSWRPSASPRTVIALEEQVSAELSHRVDSGDRVTFIDHSDPAEEGHGVRHPWEDGVMIFPDDHPLHATEREYYQAYVRGAGSRA